MKLELLQENLAKALNHVQRVVPTKPQLPILTAVLLSAKDKTISLSATDLYLGINTSLPGKVIEEGVVAIPGKIFTSSVLSLEPGKITLELEKDTLTISSPNNTTTIQCLPPDEFPDFPELNGDERVLSRELLESIEQKVGFSTSADLTRPVLTSLLFDFNDEGLLVVGTDGFRLATLELKDVKAKGDESFLVPAKALSEVVKIAQDLESEDEVKFVVMDELKQAIFKIGDTTLFARLIEGEYPPYNKIIPSDFAHSFEIDGQEFENLLKRAQVFARESSNIIRLQIKDKQMKVVANSPTYGNQEGTMTVNVKSGEGGEIAFNSRYLLELISTLSPEKITFMMNESLTPALFRPDGEENYKYIVMPFRVNQ